jgi:hypothetical protein
MASAKFYSTLFCNGFHVLGLYSYECTIQGHFNQSALAHIDLWAFLFCFVWGDWPPRRKNR